LMDEMRAAQEAGDQERVEELRQKLDEARPSQEAMFEAFFVELEGTLTEEQLARLTTFREQLTTGSRGQAGGAGDVRDVLRAAKRLTLSDEQKAKIREIERETIGAYRKLARRDKEAQASLANEVKAEIARVLDAEQVKEFEQALERSEGSRPRRDQP
jgi:(p)ppGpp synthase/HD superfamily hydrolase